MHLRRGAVLRGAVVRDLAGAVLDVFDQVAPLMNATVHQLPAANEPAVARPVQLVTARFVTLQLAEALTGLTVRAMETKIQRGQWVEGRQWVKRDGRLLIDLRGYEIWAETGRA